MRSVVVLIKNNNMLPHVETDRITKIFPRADVLSSKCGIAVWRKKYNECPTKKKFYCHYKKLKNPPTLQEGIVAAEL